MQQTLLCTSNYEYMWVIWIWMKTRLLIPLNPNLNSVWGPFRIKRIKLHPRSSYNFKHISLSMHIFIYIFLIYLFTWLYIYHYYITLNLNNYGPSWSSCDGPTRALSPTLSSRSGLCSNGIPMRFALATSSGSCLLWSVATESRIPWATTKLGSCCTGMPTTDQESSWQPCPKCNVESGKG